MRTTTDRRKILKRILVKGYTLYENLYIRLGEEHPRTEAAALRLERIVLDNTNAKAFGRKSR